MPKAQGPPSAHATGRVCAGGGEGGFDWLAGAVGAAAGGLGGEEEGVDKLCEILTVAPSPGRAASAWVAGARLWGKKKGFASAVVFVGFVVFVSPYYYYFDCFKARSTLLLLPPPVHAHALHPRPRALPAPLLLNRTADTLCSRPEAQIAEGRGLPPLADVVQNGEQLGDDGGGAFCDFFTVAWGGCM